MHYRVCQNKTTNFKMPPVYFESHSGRGSNPPGVYMTSQRILSANRVMMCQHYSNKISITGTNEQPSDIRIYRRNWGYWKLNSRIHTLWSPYDHPMITALQSLGHCSGRNVVSVFEQHGVMGITRLSNCEFIDISVDLFSDTHGVLWYLGKIEIHEKYLT